MNWDQLKTVLWLRWRLTRSQWTRGGGVGAIIAAIVAVGALVLSVVSFFAGLLGGMLALRAAAPSVVMTVWLVLTVVFLFLWLIGLVSELQRSESIDLQRLMHLPVLLGQIFVINYVASHLALSIVVLVPAMMGLAIGLAVSRGPVMLLLIPLALAMVFMITAWTYCLRGWLATLMSNPRRRRAIIMGVTAAFILLAQAPNIYLTIANRGTRARRSTLTAEQRRARDAEEQAQFLQLLEAQVAIPPLWVPVGAKALAEGRALPALFGAFGCLGIGALGLRRAYRSTLRFYQGETGGTAAAPAGARRRAAAPARPARDGTSFLERQLPGVPEQAAALALATFRSMLRAPEVKMQWGTSFIVTVAVGAPLLFRSTSSLPDGAKPFVATGVVVFSIFLLVAFLANQFGLDRDGFRALVLSPADRRLILLGKNLASLPVAAASATLLLVAVTIWLRLSPFVFLATVCQIVAGVLIASVGGNLLSILVLYRIQPGSMKPTKTPGLSMVTLVVSQLAFPIVLSPVFVPPLIGFLWQLGGGPSAGLVNLALSLVLAAATVFAYRQTLGPLGRLLQRREAKILSTVSVQVE